MSGRRILVVAPLDDVFTKVVQDFGWGDVLPKSESWLSSVCQIKNPPK